MKTKASVLLCTLCEDGLYKETWHLYVGVDCVHSSIFPHSYFTGTPGDFCTDRFLRGNSIQHVCVYVCVLSRWGVGDNAYKVCIYIYIYECSMLFIPEIPREFFYARLIYSVYQLKSSCVFFPIFLSLSPLTFFFQAAEDVNSLQS